MLIPYLTSKCALQYMQNLHHVVKTCKPWDFSYSGYITVVASSVVLMLIQDFFWNSEWEKNNLSS